MLSALAASSASMEPISGARLGPGAVRSPKTLQLLPVCSRLRIRQICAKPGEPPVRSVPLLRYLSAGVLSHSYDPRPRRASALLLLRGAVPLLQKEKGTRC